MWLQDQREDTTYDAEITYAYHSGYFEVRPFLIRLKDTYNCFIHFSYFLTPILVSV